MKREGTILKILNREPINAMVIPGLIREENTSIITHEKIDPEYIIQKTKEYFNLESIHECTRKIKYVAARYVAIYLIKEFNKNLSYKEVGSLFPRRQKKGNTYDHSSVIYALDRIKKLIKSDDPTVCPAIKMIKKNIYNDYYKFIKKQDDATI